MDILAALQTALAPAYTIERELGGGGMSRVFLADEPALHRKIVIKVLPPEFAMDVSIERFKREILLAASAHHPHIVPVLTAGEVGGLPFYTMPYVSGESLRARLDTQQPMGVAECVRILRDVAHALTFAHERGIVHRDIKPDNVLLSGGAAAVADFGVAKALSVSTIGREHAHGSLTSIGAAVGTPAYMAPELAAGNPDIDHRVDIYSLGAMAYEMLTGSRVFAGTPQQVIAAHIASTPAPLVGRRPDVPRELSELVMQSLEKSPDRRPPSATEFLARLDEVPLSGTYGRLAQRQRFARRAIGRAGLIAAGTISAAALVYTLSGSKSVEFGPRTSSAPMQVVAILPVEFSGDSARRYLAAGMTEEFASRLSVLPQLRLIDQRSVVPLIATTGAPERMSTELGVTRIVAGHLQTTGEQAHLRAAVVAVPSGDTLWSRQYDVPMHEIPAVQAGLGTGIAEVIAAITSPDGATRRVVNYDAYDLYMRSLAKPRTGAGTREAIALLRGAIALDSAFARAHSRLAIEFLSEARAGQLVYYDSADASARRALLLDPQLPAAYNALAVVAASRQRYHAARQAYLKGIELDPNSLTMMANLSVIEGTLGRFDETLHWAVRAVEINPGEGGTYTFVSTGLVSLGALQAAEAYLKRILARFPAQARGHYQLAMVNLYLGRDSVALAMMREAHRQRPNSGEVRTIMAEMSMLVGASDAEAFVAPMARENPTDHGWLSPESLRSMHALLYARRGDRIRADSLWNECMTHAQREIAAGADGYDDPMEIAAIHAARGDTVAALSWLERGYRAGFKAPMQLARDPFFAGLRNNTQFRDMLARMTRDIDVMRQRAMAAHDSLFAGARR